MQKNAQVKLTIKTLNQEKVFETLRQSNIKLFSLKRLNKFETQFSIAARNISKTQEILSKFNAEILEKTFHGMAKIWQTLLNRVFVVIATCICLFFYVFLNAFVCKTTILGTETLSKQEIQMFLEQNKFMSGLTPKSHINNFEIELALIQNFSEISMASVAVKGLSLVINVKEKQDIQSSSVSQNIIANFNGRITSITVQSGKKMVNVGDIVQVGDILVSSESEQVNSGVVPKAQISAEAWVEENYVHFEKTVQQVPTGKTLKTQEVYAFGLPVYTSSLIPKFENYETTERIIFPRNTILPLKIIKKTFAELQSEEIFVPYASVQDKIKEQCRNNALQKLNENVIIVKENASERIADGVVYLSYVVTYQVNLN